MVDFQIKLGQSIEDIKKYVQQNKDKFGEKASSIMMVLNDDVDGKVSNIVERTSYECLLKNSVFPKVQHTGVQNPLGVGKCYERGYVNIFGTDAANVPVSYRYSKASSLEPESRIYLYEFLDACDTFEVDDKGIIQSRKTIHNDKGVVYHDDNFDGIYDRKSIIISTGCEVTYHRTKQGNWQMDMIDK